MTSLRLNDVDCHYGPLLALDGTTVEFPAGSVTALVGGNGSGKSTLLEAIAGTISPSRGTVTGRPDNIAFVPQRSRVPDQLPISVRRTASMGRWRTRGVLGRLSAGDRDIVDQALERMGIADLADRRLGELSGGQRQRALICQGLAQQAPLLLLDEPLAAVDEHAAEYIRLAVAEERERGVTVVLATHHREQAAAADRVVSLDQGRVVSVE